MFQRDILYRGKAAVSSALILLLTLSFSLEAQPSLNFKRAVVTWPTVQLYFTALCQGGPQDTLNKAQNLRLYENGEEITDFDLVCPDPAVHCPMSIALVFDASGSMIGAGNQAAVAGGLAFVDTMDGITDEAAIVWFTSNVTVFQAMTTDKFSLQTAVQSLPANGATAVWDGIFVGIQEVNSTGSNPCRAVIAITDGEDNSSSHTSNDVIAMAQNSGIPVYTIGLGNSVNASDLGSIALNTGGLFFHTQDPAQIASFYTQIAAIIQQNSQDCMITYHPRCADGTLRTVDLSLVSFCGGGDTKTKTYIAPKDTSSLIPLIIELGKVTGDGGSNIKVPLKLETTIPTPENFYPSTFRVMFDPTCVSFVGIDAPPGSLLDTVTFIASPAPGVVEIRTVSKTKIQGSGLLAELVFLASDKTDTTYCGLQLAAWTFSAGCYKADPKSGEIVIVPSTELIISASGPTAFCDGDSVVLTASEKFTGYQWSSGDTTRSIVVRASGIYTVSATNEQGQPKTSQPLAVLEYLPIYPTVTPSQPQTACDGASVTLTASGGYQRYLWSNGDTTRQIQATQNGMYFCTVTNNSGCQGKTPPVSVKIVQTLAIAVAGDTLVCDSLTREYVATLDSNWTCSWAVESGTIESGQNTNRVRVRWYSGFSLHGLTLTATDTAGGCSGQQTLVVRTEQAVKPVIVPQGPLYLCAGDSVRLDAGGGYASYQWSNNAATRFLTVRSSGAYWVKVSTTEGCEFRSDTVVVTVSTLSASIAGPMQACLNIPVFYSTVAQPGLTYDWKVTGGAILSGGGTSSIEVQWGTAGNGFVEITERIGTCESRDSLVVAVGPAVRPVITALGPMQICDGDSVLLDAGEGYSLYRWSTGDTSRSVTVRQTGWYTVFVELSPGCSGTSDTVLVMVNPAAAKPLIAGPTVLCLGDSITLDAGPGYRAFIWSNGRTTRTIGVTQPGTYFVLAEDQNGCTALSDTFVVAAHPAAVKPVIAFAGLNQLSTDLAVSYQWFLNGTPLPGATTQQIPTAGPGVYTVTVTDTNGCKSTSDPFDVLSAGNAPTAAEVFAVYPNPFDNQLQVSATLLVPGEISIVVYDLLGKERLRISDRAGISYERTFDVSALPRGLYVLRIATPSGGYTKRVMRR